MLSFDEKAMLADHYAPILFFRPGDDFDPIRVEDHIRRSALWCNKPVSGDRINWGDCDHTPADSFPRSPLVEAFNLRPEVVPGNIPGGPVWMGTVTDEGFRPYQVSNEERELFLQRVSWFAGDGPDAAGGANTSAENGLSPDPLRDAKAYYFVEIHDQDTVGTIQRDLNAVPPRAFRICSEVFSVRDFGSSPTGSSRPIMSSH